MRDRVCRLLGGLLAITISLTAPAAALTDAPLHVERAGESSHLVVFLPGLNSAGSLWQPWATGLADSHRVLTVTMAGFAGTNPAGLSEQFYDRLIPALQDLLAEEGAQDATLVGHSLGGLAALMLARAEPDRVGSVLVVDSLPYLAAIMLPGLPPDQAAGQAKALGERMKAQRREDWIAQTKAGLGRQSKTAAFKDTLAAWTEAADQATVAQALQETLAMDYRPQLADIAQPVTILVPWDPAMGAPRSLIEALYRSQYASLPRGEIRMIDNSFHFIMIDRPDAFSAALTEVLQ
ncbi:MAG: alpha/beta fold hydrolase [Rhodothalassiaceae bacterium]